MANASTSAANGPKWAQETRSRIEATAPLTLLYERRKAHSKVRKLCNVYMAGNELFLRHINEHKLMHVML
jgi:hypothetical protein